MSQIILEFDNTLEKSEIRMPLVSSSKSEGGDNYSDTNITDKAQTSVFGIQVPLIAVNSTVIDFADILYFNLKSTGKLPELTITLNDKFQLITNIDKPGNDNEVRVQLLPKFDNAYKKIDLTFYINSISVTGSLLQLYCTYKIPALIASKFESFGELSTYEMFKAAATDTKLGFASNVSESGDVRYIYSDNKSWLDLLDYEIQFANTTDHIFDWWVDLWDNINLVDIKERYNAIDSDDDIKIWVAGQVNEVTVDNTVTPTQMPAILTDHPSKAMTEMFVTNYSIENNPGANAFSGSDRVYSIYEENKNEYLDHLIQDGDIKNDIFTKYEYLGESYSDYNYLLSKCIREGFNQKIMLDKIKVTLKSPLLGLMRGHKVNYIRYVNDDNIENKMKKFEEVGIVDRNVESNIPLKDYEITEDGGSGKFRLDKTVSAQYLIYEVDIVYNNNKWEYILTLVKPALNNVNIKKS